MKSSQSKFSNKKSAGTTKSGTNPSSSGCCCGSKYAEDVEDVEIVETEEK